MDLNGVKALPTGNIINFHNPGDYKFDISEIAQLLSKVIRFNGFGTDVVTHSFYVAEVLLDLTGNPHIALLGLLHDAHEAYTGDISSPVKHILGKKLEDLERMVQRAILWQLNAKHEDGLGADRLIKLVDLLAMREEVTAMVTAGNYKLDNEGVWEEALRPVANINLLGIVNFPSRRIDAADFIRFYDYLCEKARNSSIAYTTTELLILGEMCKFKVTSNALISQLL